MTTDLATALRGKPASTSICRTLVAITFLQPSQLRLKTQCYNQEADKNKTCDRSLSRNTTPALVVDRAIFHSIRTSEAAGNLSHLTRLGPAAWRADNAHRSTLYSVGGVNDPMLGAWVSNCERHHRFASSLGIDECGVVRSPKHGAVLLDESQMAILSPEDPKRQGVVENILLHGQMPCGVQTSTR